MNKSLPKKNITKRALGWDVKLGVVLSLLAVALGLATYGALTETPPFGNDPDTVFRLLNVDLVVLLCLVALIARRVAILFSGRRRGVAGSKLHVRLVFVFSVLALLPSVIMAVFSIYFFHFGVQSWFSEKVRTAVEGASAVASAYMAEHKGVIRADIMAMAHDMNRQADIFLENSDALETIMGTQSMLRNLPEAIIFGRDGQVLSRSNLSFSVSPDIVPSYAFEQSSDGEVVLLSGEGSDRIRALVRLDGFGDEVYLLVGRMIDPDVILSVENTSSAVSAYQDLQGRYSGLRISVTMIYIIVALLLMLVAIWVGLLFARQIVGPIGSLVRASERVSSGDFDVLVDDVVTFDEFSFLAQSFNKMTRQLGQQRRHLIEVNRQLDQRRRFTETVLAEVSSGIIGLDTLGVITLANMRALDILDADVDTIEGLALGDLLPEAGAFVSECYRLKSRVSERHITFHVRGGSGVSLFLRFGLIVDEHSQEVAGAVLTIDDVTELELAQRNAAWSDVAQRIAHEIKNPLTPIQLSAERLKRRYLKEIKDRPEIFEQCIETIIRRVDDIGRMVSEFSEFARLPAPKMGRHSVSDVADHVLFLERQAHLNVTFSNDISQDLSVMCDEGQMRQVFTNLIQNAVDSVLEHCDGSDGSDGMVGLKGGIFGQSAYVCVYDNGAGFAEDVLPAALVEPYVTKKENGTGLGLAIVRKIIEEHGGRLIMGYNADLKHIISQDEVAGALVSFTLPVDGT